MFLPQATDEKKSRWALVRQRFIMLFQTFFELHWQ
jgi:hypothetical protein